MRREGRAVGPVVVLVAVALGGRATEEEEELVMLAEPVRV